jgi:hypothetical protein
MRDEQAHPFADSVGVIFDTFQAALQNEIPWEQAFQAAASAELARVVTPETVARLSEEFIRRAPQFGAATLKLAELMMRHAGALDDLGRTGEVLPLYESTHPRVRAVRATPRPWILQCEPSIHTGNLRHAT